MKKIYNKPEIKVIKVDVCDIICTSPSQFKMNLYDEEAVPDLDSL